MHTVIKRIWDQRSREAILDEVFRKQKVGSFTGKVGQKYRKGLEEVDGIWKGIMDGVL